MNVKIKILRSRLMHLVKMLTALQAVFEVTTRHEALLSEHLALFVADLTKLVNREKWDNTIKLNGVEAVAMCQLTEYLYSPDDEYGAVILNYIQAEVDKVHVNNRHNMELPDKQPVLKQLK